LSITPQRPKNSIIFVHYSDYFIFLGGTPKQPCKLARKQDLPKSISHAMTVFVLWHDSLCHAMGKKEVPRKTVK